MTKAMKRVTCLACVAVMGLGAAMFAACEKEGGTDNPVAVPKRLKFTFRVPLPLPL